jgi:dethiobiotin synthetase
MATSCRALGEHNLGAINRSLLSIDALRRRLIDILWLSLLKLVRMLLEQFCDIGRVRRFGRLPWIAPMSADTLQAAFKASFWRDVFKP